MGFMSYFITEKQENIQLSLQTKSSLTVPGGLDGRKTPTFRAASSPASLHR